jgi:hypothetical protein
MQKKYPNYILFVINKLRIRFLYKIINQIKWTTSKQIHCASPFHSGVKNGSENQQQDQPNEENIQDFM